MRNDMCGAEGADKGNCACGRGEIGEHGTVSISKNSAEEPLAAMTRWCCFEELTVVVHRKHTVIVTLSEPSPHCQ